MVLNTWEGGLDTLCTHRVEEMQKRKDKCKKSSCHMMRRNGRRVQWINANCCTCVQSSCDAAHLNFDH